MENMGPFKLEAVLGRGGMGTVYRAKYTETDEIVAVKVLSPAFTADDHFRSRFESEIKALLKLDHPNIVRLVSYGQYEHNLYFAMELVEGKSLFQMQRDGEIFHWREVLRIAKNVALGLRHAHDRGVIHRDLKPGNLLKAFAGIIKITDFGIAKSFGTSQDTGTNVLGTVDFMSPEQAKGQPVTFKSDLYSLGAVMYTLLGGKPPFTGNSVEESMRNLTRVPAPRVSRIAPDVPAEIDDLIAQLLEKKPENRIHTALSLYHQLKQAEHSLKESAQALTAEHPAVVTSEKTRLLDGPLTSVDEDKEKAQTVQHESVEAQAGENMASAVTRSDALTGNQTGPKLIKAEDDRDDFFTTVTDNERMVHLDITEGESEPPSAVDKILLGGLLVCVFALGAWGIYRANQIPTADELFSVIEEQWDRPQKCFAEIELFLKHYGDHENSAAVENRKELAKSFHKVVELRNRRRKNQELSELENGFLEIMNQGTSDLTQSSEELNALISIYQGDENLTEKDLECIRAAKAKLLPMKQEAEQQRRKIRDNIENQLERAKTLSKLEAREFLNSIIELNKKYDWAVETIGKAREALEALDD